MTQPPVQIGAILGLRDPCDHSTHFLARCVGNNAIGIWCEDCRCWVTKEKSKCQKQWIPKDDDELVGKDLGNLPRVGEKIYRKCQGPCAQLATCQFHHLAPRAFFGDECDQWPTGWLCVGCHARWHAKVTPGLCTPHDATDHARTLLEYLGVDRAARLTKALMDLGKVRRGAA
jgi:hypothetical protein